MAATKEFSSTDSTIIGPSILISGKLSGDEDLTVRGRVEGELNLTKTLIVEPSVFRSWFLEIDMSTDPNSRF